MSTETEARERMLRYFEAIPDPNLSIATRKFLHWLLTNDEGIMQQATPKSKELIRQIAGLHQHYLKGHKPDREEWFKVWELNLTPTSGNFPARVAYMTSEYALYEKSNYKYAACCAGMAADIATQFGMTYQQMAEKLADLLADGFSWQESDY